MEKCHCYSFETPCLFKDRCQRWGGVLTKKRKADGYYFWQPITFNKVTLQYECRLFVPLTNE